MKPNNPACQHCFYKSFRNCQPASQLDSTHAPRISLPMYTCRTSSPTTRNIIIAVTALHEKRQEKNAKLSGLGETAAHGKQMDEKRSRDKNWKEEEISSNEESHLSRKDRKH